MSVDLHDLLDRGAAPRPTSVDGDALVARGIRRRRTKRAGAGVLAAVALVAGGAVVADLGQSPDIPFVGEAPDAATLTWTQIDDAPLLPRERAAVAVDGDRVVFWGGEGGEPGEDYVLNGTTYMTVELQDGALYDATTDEWRHVAAPPSLSVRSRPTVSLVGESFLVWGGQNARPVGPGGTVYADDLPLEMDGATYDLVTETWSLIPPAPLLPRTPAVVAWDGETLLVWGGSTLDGRVMDDGATWTDGQGWTAIAAFPLAAREGSAIAWDEQRLVVWGGGTNLDAATGDDQLLADGAVYDRDADTWAVLPPVDLTPRWFSYDKPGARALLDGDRFYVLGGAMTSPRLEYYLDGAWLDLSTGIWTPTAEAPEAITYVDPDAAGAVGLQRTASGGGELWVFDPQTDGWIRTNATEGRTVRAGDRIVVYPEGISVPAADGWRPLAIISADGSTAVPVLADRGTDSRSFASIAALESGVVLFGGFGEIAVGEDSYTGTGQLNSAWFLPYE